MIFSRAQRRMRVIALRCIRGTRTHALTLLSAGVIATLAVVALSNDAFQNSRRPAPEAVAPPASNSAPAGRDQSLTQHAAGLAWIADGDPQLGMLYFDEAARLTPLERARLRPRRPYGEFEEPLWVTLIDGTPQEQAEALLTALKDAEALGLRLEVVE